MDEQDVRGRAQLLVDALKAGDIGAASKVMSPQLQQNLGPVVAMLPLPLAEAEIEQVDTNGRGYRVLLSLTGETGGTRLETRWKDRDGTPTMVEASHVPDEPAPASLDEEEEA